MRVIRYKMNDDPILHEIEITDELAEMLYESLGPFSIGESDE